MPRNSSGTFTLAESAFVPNTSISSSAVNSDLSDIATGLTDSLSRTGQGGMSAALGLSLSGWFYTSDPDTGMSRSALNTQVISCGGQDWTFTETEVTAPDGTSLAPLIGEIRMWALPTAPTGWLLMRGQACTTTYPLWRAALVAAGNPYGTSGGDPLFPDMQCVVPAGVDGTSRGLLTGSSVLGALLGSQTATVSIAQIQSFTPTGSVSITDPGHTHQPSQGNPGAQFVTFVGAGGGNNLAAGANASATTITTLNTTGITATFGGNAIGSGQGHANVQPTIVLNFIGRAA